METRIAFTGKQQAITESFTPAAPKDGEVLLRSRLSLVSTGTEGIVYNRLFEPGTHWDNWVKYPFFPGYATVADVTAVGPGVTTLKVGDRVVARVSHASAHVTAAAGCYAVPAGVTDAQAIWFALAKITAMGARVAQYRLGSQVLVIGAGPVGQMSLRWAAAAGADQLLVVDPVAMRLELAKRGGATSVFSAGVLEALPAIKDALGGNLPEIVLDTTGIPAVFAGALQAVAKYGSVIIVGDAGAPSNQHLSSEVMMKGMRIQAAHDGHETPDWNSARIIPYFFQLVQRGRFNVDGLNTHTFRPAQAQEMYTFATQQRAATMGLVIDWSK